MSLKERLRASLAAVMPRGAEMDAAEIVRRGGAGDTKNVSRAHGFGLLSRREVRSPGGRRYVYVFKHKPERPNKLMEGLPAWANPLCYSPLPYQDDAAIKEFFAGGPNMV